MHRNILTLAPVRRIRSRSGYRRHCCPAWLGRNPTGANSDHGSDYAHNYVGQPTLTWIIPASRANRGERPAPRLPWMPADPGAPSPAAPHAGDAPPSDDSSLVAHVTIPMNIYITHIQTFRGRQGGLSPDGYPKKNGLSGGRPWVSSCRRGPSSA